MRELRITCDDEGRRLDKYLLKYLDKASSGTIYKGLRKKNIKLNDARAEGKEILKAGDVIRLFFSEDTFSLLSSASYQNTSTCDMKSSDYSEVNNERYDSSSFSNTKRKQIILKKKCSIVYEDDNIIIADKPAGLLSQKANANDESINEILLDYVRADANVLGTFTPSVCNRLDRNTSGLITFAKTYSAARLLSELFGKRNLKKYYLTVVKGRLEGSGHLKAYIRKDNENNSACIYNHKVEGATLIETAYECIDITSICNDNNKISNLLNDSNYETSLLKVELLTGKTHQIRAHFANIGHPVIGDPKYGDLSLNKEIKKKYGIDRQILHSFELVMPDDLCKPFDYLSGQIFKSSIPVDFQ